MLLGATAALAIATPALAAWQTVPIVSSGNAMGETSSVVTRVGSPVFVAYHLGGDDLFWARRTSTGWKRTQVAGANSNVACYGSDADWAGPSAALTTMGDGRIASACMAVGGGSPVKYSSLVDGRWRTRVIGSTPPGESGDASAVSVDLSLTPSNAAHIVVGTRTPAISRFRRESGQWVRDDLVEFPSLCCIQPLVSAAVDPVTGNLGVAWNSQGFGGYLSFASFDGTGAIVGGGDPENLDLAGDLAYGRPSLGFLSNGDPVIAFQHGPDGGDRRLSIARRVSGAWSLDPVDATTGDVGADPAMMIDGDAIHIAYEDVTNGDLRYANSPDAATWTLATISSAGSVGGFPSLATKGSQVKIAHFHAAYRLRYTSGP